MGRVLVRRGRAESVPGAPQVPAREESALCLTQGHGYRPNGAWWVCADCDDVVARPSHRSPRPGGRVLVTAPAAG